MNQRGLLQLIFIILALAVILGAFGAHALKEILGEGQLKTWETASRYHFYHALGALGVLVLHRQTTSTAAKWSVRFLLVGMLLFCGSLYLLATRDVLGVSLGWLGPVTPLGGICLITGWVCAVASVKDLYQ